MDEKLARLRGMNKSELLQLWEKEFTEPAPAKHSPALLRWEIAWRIQSATHGGISGQTGRRIKSLAAAFQKNSDHLPHAVPRLTPGVVLSREWRGTLHTVQVAESGFIHNGVRHPTLSSVARKITGTQWSGPAFFGMKKKSERSKADQ